MPKSTTTKEKSVGCLLAINTRTHVGLANYMSTCIRNYKVLDKPVFQDRSKPGEEVLDGWSHLCHADDVDNGLESSQYAAQNFRVLLTKVLIKNNTKMTKQLLLLVCVCICMCMCVYMYMCTCVRSVHVYAMRICVCVCMCVCVCVCVCVYTCVCTQVSPTLQHVLLPHTHTTNLSTRLNQFYPVSNLPLFLGCRV